MFMYRVETVDVLFFFVMGINTCLYTMLIEQAVLGFLVSLGIIIHPIIDFENELLRSYYLEHLQELLFLE